MCLLGENSIAKCNIYIKSIAFSESSDVESIDNSVPKNLVIDSNNLNGAILTAVDGLNQSTGVLTINSMWNGMNVIKLDSTNTRVDDSAPRYSGELKVAGLTIDTAVYKYIKITYCVDPIETIDTAGKIPGYTGWYDNNGTILWKANVGLDANCNGKTLDDFVEKWDTLVIQVPESVRGATPTGVNLCLLGENSIAKCNIYIQSITFSTDAETADDYIVAHGAQNRTDATGVRFISVVKDIDLEDYKAVGMKITTADGDKNGAWDLSSTTVYTSLIGGGNDYTPDGEVSGGKYFSALTMTGIPSDANVTFIIVPYLIKTTGEMICGEPLNIDVVNGTVPTTA